MKIAIPISGDNLDAPIARHIGRAENFIIYDLRNKRWEVLPNPFYEARSHAELDAAEFLIKKAVDAVISGYFGPYAAKELDAAGIQMLLAPTTPRELLGCFEAGQLTEMTLAAHVAPELYSRPEPTE